jgi:hypothetical protein
MEVIVFRPADTRGMFDVREVRERLDQWRDCIADPHEADVVLVEHGEVAQDYRRQRRLADPTSSRACGVIVVRAEMVVLDHAWATPEARHVMREFAQWMVGRYRPRVFSEVEGDDWTERCGGDVDVLFAL